jgi:hypothetical protein
MFDKISEAAEKLATNVSRREFMGGLGKGALALAGAMGAMLAFPRLVQAGKGLCSCGNWNVLAYIVCKYGCPDGSTMSTSPTGPNCTCNLIEDFHKDHGCVLQSVDCINV